MSTNGTKEGENQGESEINAPLVFQVRSCSISDTAFSAPLEQCKNCNSIVGDTLSFVLADEEAKTVTLSG